MNCPMGDKLSQFVDQLLPEQERAEIEAHVQTCPSCGKAVHAFQQEQRFIEETLQAPSFPNNFTDLVLDQLEPYGKAKKQWKTVWKRAMLTAAGVVLAVGIGATVNPAFAQLIGGLFSTDQVDDGLKVAAEAGLTQRVDLQVEDQGVTFVVEDVIADSSRVSLSYKVLNNNGKPQDTHLDVSDSGNQISATDQNGLAVDNLGMGWQDKSEYGFIEFSLRGHGEVDQLTIHFDLVELNGVKGNWQLDVPVDLVNQKLTKTVELANASASHHGVDIQLKKWQIAPSSMELFFETSFSEEEQMKSEKARHEFEKLLGKGSVESLVQGNNTGIVYHLENADGKVIASAGRSSDSGTIGMLQGTGGEIGNSAGTAWIDSFIPAGEDELFFVLDGVYKKEPTGLSQTFNPKAFKQNSVSFDFKGNHLSIKSVKKPLIGKDRSVVIRMEGSTESLDADLGSYIAVDGNGNSYPANFSSSILNKKDKNGRHIATIDLRLDGLKKVPEELTLYLISMTSYYPVEKPWKVPLTGE